MRSLLTFLSNLNGVIAAIGKLFEGLKVTSGEVPLALGRATSVGEGQF